MLRTLLGAALAAAMSAQEPFFPDATYDPEIPDLQRVVGHRFGETITSHAQTTEYLRALAQASPRAQLVRYGESWEGRALHYLVIATPQRLARLDEIKATMRALADPRSSGHAAAAERSDMPAVAWLAYSVHGNEISCTDAALLTAYHLVAAQNEPLAQAVLDNCVVIVDPLQNPDGRDRFVHHYEQTRGRWPDADPHAAEHDEPWPGGRTNHYLFDMNRDWFALTQPESRARVRAFLEWFPLVYVDVHEMGTNSTYYFPPPAPPLNPLFAPAQVRWLEAFGRHNARWFDRMGFQYFTREVFDAFYPGYGEGWPMFQGAIGMTYEQATVRGLVIEREDRVTVHYRDSVQRHFIASLATLETAARERAELLASFVAFRREGIADGERAAVREYLLPPGRDADRTRKLVALLQSQGVEVEQARSAFVAQGAPDAPVADYEGNTFERRELPAGTWIVPAAQPARRLVETLMAQHQPLDEEFLKAEEERRTKRQSSEIYDITAWSLPLLFDVECYRAPQRSARDSAPVTAIDAEAGAVVTKEPGAPVVYAIAWGTQAAARALAAIFRAGLRVACADKPFRLLGETFPAGSLVLHRADNPDDLGERLAAIARDSGARVLASPTTWVEDGINLGSNKVRHLEAPKIALAWREPTQSYSAGWTRYVLEQAYGHPVTIVPTRGLASADLQRYNVLILPDARGGEGGYGSALGKALPRLKHWIEGGGTLVAFGEATRWLTEKEIGLLPSKQEKRSKPGEKKEQATAPKPEEERPEAAAESPAKPTPAEDEPFDLHKATQPDEELPDATPGAIVRVDLDGEHWLAFGYPGRANVLISSRNIFTPIKLDAGRNVGVYAKEDQLVRSGLIWPQKRKQLAQKAYLVHRPLGKGHVVAFAEDPNYRAFCDGLNLLFLNAVFFGPGH
jgi:hypothetical protein